MPFVNQWALPPKVAVSFWLKACYLASSWICKLKRQAVSVTCSFLKMLILLELTNHLWQFAKLQGKTAMTFQLLLLNEHPRAQCSKDMWNFSAVGFASGRATILMTSSVPDYDTGLKKKSSLMLFFPLLHIFKTRPNNNLITIYYLKPAYGSHKEMDSSLCWKVETSIPNISESPNFDHFSPAFLNLSGGAKSKTSCNLWGSRIWFPQ